LPEFRIGLILDSPIAPIDRDYRARIGDFVARLEAAGAAVQENAHPAIDPVEAHGPISSCFEGPAPDG
jgi:Asp-tRNA(Asn)/Glu-tRNA(Gln) amidotransferase A subunit family amidase